MLLAKATLNIIKFWFLKIDSFINYDKYFGVNNVLREQNEMKEETKHPKNAVRKTIQKKCKRTILIVKNHCEQKFQCQKN